MTNPDNVGGLRYTDHNVMNGALCDFATRWRIDGDYIRCGTCDRPQLTSYADNDFPHADFCRVKDSPNMERKPWQTYVALLAPLCRAAPAGGDGCPFCAKRETETCAHCVSDSAPAGSGEAEVFEDFAREFGADLTPYPDKWKQGDVNPPYKFQHANDLWNAWQKAHAAALLRKLQQGADEGRVRAYDQVDRFLRNNLGDEAYAKYSDALEVACGYSASQGQEGGNG